MIPRHAQIALMLLLAGIFGSGLYILHLAHTHPNQVSTNSELRFVPASSGHAQPVTLTIAYDEDGLFRHREAMMSLPEEPGARARQLLQTLITEYVNKPSPHPLADGAAVNNVFFVNPELAVIDLNQKLADGHRSGIMVEDFTVLSLIETLADNFPQVQQVKILVNGQQRETLAGHVDLTRAYSPTVVHKIVEQLE